MGVLRRKPDIRKLAFQLEHIARELQRIESNAAHLPSPAELKALAWLRFKLPELTEYAATLEKHLWQRIDTWQNTPYTAAQLRRRRIGSFIGWWIGGTMVLAQSVLGWFAGLFPKPWHVLPTSAVIVLIIVTIAAVRGDKNE